LPQSAYTKTTLKGLKSGYIKLNTEEWNVFQLLQNSSFGKSNFNRHRVELTTILSEFAFLLKSYLSKRESNKGTFDVEAARNSAHKIVSQHEILQFQRVITSALDLDAQLEHAIFLMIRSKWQSWLNLIETLALLLA
jgi:hypothetical protein